MAASDTSEELNEAADLQGGIFARRLDGASNHQNQRAHALEHHRRHVAIDEAEEAEGDLFGSEAPLSVAGDAPAREPIHVSCYPSFHPVLLGDGIHESSPRYAHNAATIGGWVPFENVDVDVRPKRAMCFNVPAEFLKIGATRFHQMTSDQHGSTRIADTAALISLIFAGYSKGYISGRHCELAGTEDDDEEDASPEGKKKKKKKKPTRVDGYTYFPDGDAGTVAPQVSVGYEELSSPNGDVLAVRVWLLIFDEEHATSSLVAKVIREVRVVHQNSKMNSVSANARKETLKTEQRNMRSAVMGYNMEDHSSTQFVRIYDDAELLGIIRSYSAASTDNIGRPTISAHDEALVPLGTNLVPIDGGRNAQADGLGSTHPLSIEWQFNAKRPEGLAAGLVACDNSLMDICDAQLDPSNYFDVHHNLTLPFAACGFWLQSNPTMCNIFDMVLPQALQGAIVPGPTLLGAFREMHRPTMQPNDRLLVDCFRNFVTNTDMHQARIVAAMRQVVVAPDSINVSVEERERIKHVDELLKRGPRFYGQTSESSDVIEPRNILKEVAHDQSSVDRLVVEPWIEAREKALAELDLRVAALKRDRNEKLVEGRRVQLPSADLDAFAAMYDAKIGRAQSNIRAKRHDLAILKNQIRQELFEYGAARIKRAFLTKSEYDLMPRGYQAIWDGLHAELSEMPNKSACTASVDKGMQLVHSDRSVFGHLLNWLGDFWENTAQIDGRDWRIMEQIVLQSFDVLSDSAQIMLICGPKGNGKSHRTERAMRMFSRGWFTDSGGGSSKAGMQGTSDANNGCVCVCDEMIPELVDPNQSDRIEWWKQMCTKRQFCYTKPLAHKNASGMEYLRTVKLVTPNYATYIMCAHTWHTCLPTCHTCPTLTRVSFEIASRRCTNHGPAFTRKDDEPSEVKAALIDRSIVQFARTLGTTTRSDNELERNLLHPENAKKVRTFRLLTTLTALVKMLIWRQSIFQPDFAMAQRMWDEWDRRLDQQYGLPRLTPRKNAKRVNDCLTLTIMNAVACVFLYKQTACHFDTYPKEDEDAPAFDVAQLWKCVQLLQPTPEIIHHAWTCSLEYHIGTSCMGLAALSAVCDLYGRKPGDLLRRPPSWSFTEMENLCKEVDEKKKNVANGGAAGAGAAANANRAPVVNNGFAPADSPGMAAAVNNMTQPMSQKKRPRLAKQMFHHVNELVPLFRGADALVSQELIARMRDQFRFRRQARVAYRLKNLETNLQSRNGFDSNAHIDETLEPKLASVGHVNDEHYNAAQLSHLKKHGLPVFEPAIVQLHSTPPSKQSGSSEHQETMRYYELAYLPPAPMHGIDGNPLLHTDEEKRAEMVRQERNYLDGVAKGADVYLDNGDLEEYKDDADIEFVRIGYHTKRAAVEGFDASNCPGHVPFDDADGHQKCIYCSQKDTNGPVQLISLATSSIWADAVEAACFYSLQSLCEFATFGGILVTDKTSGAPGMRPLGRDLAFKQTGQMNQASATGDGGGESGVGGATVYDLGWICKHSHCQNKSPWDRVARQMDNHSWTAKAFDLHHEGIRDLLYLISMRDNARRVAVLPGINDLKAGFVDEHGHKPTENAKLVKFAPKTPAPSFGISDANFHLHAFPPRHPASLVEDSHFQRACDARSASGQLVGLEVLASPNIIRAPPIRQNFELVEASTTAMHDHICLLVESSFTATLMPGLRNMQETFSNGEVGPTGFSSRTCATKKAADKAKDGENAEAVGAEAASSGDVTNLSNVHELPDAEPPRKRAASVTSAVDETNRTVASEPMDDEIGIHTLAMSYDVIQISIALDMAECIYDSTKAQRLAQQQANTNRTLVPTIGDLAHLTLRFPGYNEKGRQTISMPIPTKPLADVTMPEDAIDCNKQVGRRYVSLMLGRHATEADLQDYTRRLKGGRNMDGVTGCLFDTATWLKHTVHTMRRRGLLHGVVNDEVGLEPAFAVLRSMPTGLLERFVEASYLDKQLGFAHLGLEQIAMPGSYWQGDDYCNKAQVTQDEKAERESESTHDNEPLPTTTAPSTRAIGSPSTESEVDLSPMSLPGVPFASATAAASNEQHQEVLPYQKDVYNPAPYSDDDMEED